MIDTINLVNYQSSAECRTDWQYDQEGFLKITYQFKKGNVYGIVSDFGCGSWGLVTCIGGRGENYFTGKIMLNGYEILAQELSVYSAFLTEKIIPEINCIENLGSAKECIQKALDVSGQKYTVEDIKSIFHLSDERFDRPLDCVSGEIWIISMAIQFALGKEIFCFPWLNMQYISKFIGMCELGIIDFLRSTGKIVLIPTSQKKIVKKYCDHVISLEKRVGKKTFSWR